MRRASARKHGVTKQPAGWLDSGGNFVRVFLYRRNVSVLATPPLSSILQAQQKRMLGEGPPTHVHVSIAPLVPHVLGGRRCKCTGSKCFPFPSSCWWIENWPRPIHGHCL